MTRIEDDTSTPEAIEPGSRLITKPPVLPMKVRLRVAALALVPKENQKLFCDAIQLPLQLVWELDRRATGTKAQSALIRASEAARALNQAFKKLEPDDREWVEGIWAKWPLYEKWLPVLPRSVEAIEHLFSIAVNRAPSQSKLGPHKRGRRKGDVKDLSFRQFVHYLLVVTEEWCGGKLPLDRIYESGALIDAIKILGKYLPKGVVRYPLPFNTIERVKNNPGHYTGFPDIDFFRIK
jgi:hypothetical protein